MMTYNEHVLSENRKREVYLAGDYLFRKNRILKISFCIKYDFLRNFLEKRRICHFEIRKKRKMEDFYQKTKDTNIILHILYTNKILCKMLLVQRVLGNLDNQKRRGVLNLDHRCSKSTNFICGDELNGKRSVLDTYITKLFIERFRIQYWSYVVVYLFFIYKTFSSDLQYNYKK